MKKLSALSILLFWVLFASVANARETAVLLPVTGPLTPLELTELTREVVTGLSSVFDVKHGEEVNRVVKQIFKEESKKTDCDETSCYRQIAVQYHAEKIIALRLTQIETERYLLTLNVYDVVTGDVTVSNKRECTSCTFEKIKILARDLIGAVSVSKDVLNK